MTMPIVNGTLGGVDEMLDRVTSRPDCGLLPPGQETTKPVEAVAALEAEATVYDRQEATPEGFHAQVCGGRRRDGHAICACQSRRLW